MYIHESKSAWKIIATVLCLLFPLQVAIGRSEGPPPPSVTDLATQQKHITEGIQGNGSYETVCRNPRNYFPFIQTPEGQAILNAELAKLGSDTWRDTFSLLREALIAFVALRGDEDWYQRFSKYCEDKDNDILGRGSIVTAVGEARTERSKRFVSEQLEVAYAEAIEAASPEWHQRNGRESEGVGGAEATAGAGRFPYKCHRCRSGRTEESTAEV